MGKDYNLTFQIDGSDLLEFNSNTLSIGGTTMVSGATFSFQEPIEPKCDYCGKKGNGVSIYISDNKKVERKICNKCMIKVFDKILGFDNVVANRL